jgi:hypothetical protein
VFSNAMPIAAVARCTNSVPVQRLRQVLLAVESARLEYISHAAIEALNHVIGARRLGLGQTVLNTQLLTRLIKHVFTTWDHAYHWQTGDP